MKQVPVGKSHADAQLGHSELEMGTTQTPSKSFLVASHAQHGGFKEALLRSWHNISFISHVTKTKTKSSPLFKANVAIEKVTQPKYLIQILHHSVQVLPPAPPITQPKYCHQPLHHLAQVPHPALPITQPNYLIQLLASQPKYCHQLLPSPRPSTSFSSSHHSA